MAHANNFVLAHGRASGEVDRFHSDGPPPSTLASHLAPVHGLVENQFDQKSFELLLDEALGSDENGHPNLGDDTDINATLILVICQAGIATALKESNDNPFASRTTGRQSLQLCRCFEVIQLAVENSPRVLYTPWRPDVADVEEGQHFLYEMLLSKLLAFLAVSANLHGEAVSKCCDLIAAVLAIQTNPHTPSTEGQILRFIHICVEGTLGLVYEPTAVSSKNDSETPFPVLQISSLISHRKDNYSVPVSLILTIARTLGIISREQARASPHRQVEFTTNTSLLIGLFDSLLKCFLDHENEVFAQSEAAHTITSVLSDILSNIYSALESGRCPIMASRLGCVWTSFLSTLLSMIPTMSQDMAASQVVNILKSTCKMIPRYVELHFSVTEVVAPVAADLLQSLSIDHTSLQDELRGLLSLSYPALEPRTTEMASLATTDQTMESEEGRPRKRLRLSVGGHENKNQLSSERICRSLTQVLSGHGVNDLQGLSKTSIAFFGRLTVAKQEKALDQLGRAACLLSSCENLPDDDKEFFEIECRFCDPNNLQEEWHIVDAETASELLRTLLALITPIQKTYRARVAGLSALRCLLLHTDATEFLELHKSSLGDWVMQSLRSSTRDVRLAAIQALDAFVRERPFVPSTVIHRNRVHLLEFLQNLSQWHEVPAHETTVVALASVARLVGDQELNIILVRLIEYLGHGNPYVSGLVYTEIQKLSESMKLPIFQLFSPFFRTIGVVAIKNISSRPAIAQQVCDLLGWSLDAFLLRIENYAVPYLVLLRKRDFIDRIGAAQNPPISSFHVCTERATFKNILSLLLTQAFHDPEDMIMEHLLNASYEFKRHDLATWLSLELSPISCELLKAMADAGQGRNSKPLQALHLLNQLASPKLGLSGSSRKGDSLAAFLETSSLAIINHFIFALSSDEARERIEKRRVLAAVGELVRLGKGRVVDALPQICACLRSAIESQDLCDTAFASWATMMNTLKDEDAEQLINQTVAIIVRHWDALSDESHQLAHTLVFNMLSRHSSVIQEIFRTIPSLSSIPSMAQFEAQIAHLKSEIDERQQFVAFTTRLKDENLVVVEQALSELNEFLKLKHELFHQAVLQEQPDSFVKELIRALLDCCVQFKDNSSIPRLGAQCLGYIGCLDPNRIDSTRGKNSLVVIDNFAKGEETFNFIVFFLGNILVKAFLSAATTRAQGFLAWAIQEFLMICNFRDAVALRSRTSGVNSTYRTWLDLPEHVRNTLTPFLTSRYTVKEVPLREKCTYPLFCPGKISYLHWLREITLDFLLRGRGTNCEMVFAISSRIITGQDPAISNFLLPFATLNAVISGTEEDKREIIQEILAVLEQPLQGDSQMQDDIRLCSETIFDILDYMFTWLQQKRKTSGAMSDRNVAGSPNQFDQGQITSVESVLAAIPADLMSRRAIDCKSYARALFNWENHMRKTEKAGGGREEAIALLDHYQEIYAQIDEPDGIEGISSTLPILNIEQQILEHRKAGRWTAAQSWYEMKLIRDPDDAEIQVNLLQCLKESGQYDVLLHHCDGFKAPHSFPKIAPYALEAAWVNDRWDKLQGYLGLLPSNQGDFNVNLAVVFRDLSRGQVDQASKLLDHMEAEVASTLTMGSTSSLQACHETLLKLHVLRDVRDTTLATTETKIQTIRSLDTRLNVLGSYVADKLYVLGVRRAAMKLSHVFAESDMASTWLTSARLARKSLSSDQAFNSILRASELGAKAATVERAKLMWQQGHHRKAIRTLEGAIETGAFASYDVEAENGSVTLTTEQQKHQNEVTAKAYVLLGKWLDTAGQTNSDVIIKTFQKATQHHRSWEKGFYYLGKYYNKILDSERAKEPGKESEPYLTGEAAKLVIDNYLKAAICGTKYIFQTLPRILTLWLDLVAGSDQAQDARRGNEKFQAHSATQRKAVVGNTNKRMKSYVEKLRPVVLYTILPQVVARLGHSNNAVYEILEAIVTRVVSVFPQQALWTLLAVTKSSSKDRQTRGLTIIRKISEEVSKSSRKPAGTEFRSMVHAGQKFFDELLRVSEFAIEGKVARVSLARDLGFNHKIAPSRLVVPVEACLIPSIPPNFESSTMKTFMPFARDPITISAFLDDASVLASLQKPRKLSIRGSDGNIYGVMAKPKDDLRKDQRLMEFNTMINRFLKRDVEASKRRLYIRTYAVVPLNEECGLVEWVENLKTYRDIVLKLYKERCVTPNYVEIRNQLNESCSGPPEKVSIFTDRILKTFPEVFYEWFSESFPDPTAWFNARLRYTRTTAVMSMVGHVLGLGDRHGENILLEEDNGGVMHVDFNCLFDKGLTFEKPEYVPFRLTHNMVDAMGPYGFDGPFRRCCEITLTLLRNNEDALMTVLETFLYDPTTDFINPGKKKKAPTPGVPTSPAEILDSVRGKVRGMLQGESVPLSVGGYVEEMIKRAVDPANLCRMYIGWCAFF